MEIPPHVMVGGQRPPMMMYPMARGPSITAGTGQPRPPQPSTNQPRMPGPGNVPYQLNEQFLFFTLFLPTAYVVRGKVMFWHVSVRLSVHRGRGVPQPGPARGGAPWPGLAGGVTQPGPARRVPHLARWGWGGLPWPGPDRGVHSPPGIGYPSPPPGTGQQMECLICCGRYASFIHAGGLSCWLSFSTSSLYVCL